MSYENLPDPRPMSVRLVLGPMPKAMALVITLCLTGLCLAAAIGLCADWREHAIGWGSAALLTGMMAVLYGIAISWSDHHKTWPRRRSLRRHRGAHRTAGSR